MRTALSRVDVPTHDLRLVGTIAPVEAVSGTTTAVPSEARYAAGPSEDPSGMTPAYRLDAATTVPGATATPDGLLVEVQGTRTHAAAVTVPDGTAPGRYALTLTATIGDQSRSGTAVVDVVPHRRSWCSHRPRRCPCRRSSTTFSHLHRRVTANSCATACRSPWAARGPVA